MSVGFQWEHGSVYYPRYPHPSCSFINTAPPPIPDTIALRQSVSPFPSPVHKRPSPCGQGQPGPVPSPTPSSPPSSPTVQRRKRTDTQRDENFLQALEAVRTGGIGFCKAARMYGVNNRTLWLEYRRRGYPITRPSLKPRASTPQMSPYQYPAVIMKKEPTDSSCSNDEVTLLPTAQNNSTSGNGNPNGNPNANANPNSNPNANTNSNNTPNPVPNYQDANPEIMFLQSNDIF